MAQYTALQTAITLCKSYLTQLNTQLTALSTSAVSAGATCPASVELEGRISTLTANIRTMQKEVADVAANLIQ